MTVEREVWHPKVIAAVKKAGLPAKTRKSKDKIFFSIGKPWRDYRVHVYQINDYVVIKYQHYIGAPGLEWEPLGSLTASCLEDAFEIAIGFISDAVTRVRTGGELDENIIDDVVDQFEKQTQFSLSDSVSRRRERLANAEKYPRKKIVEQECYDRNNDVVDEVRYLANGICECCKKAAPFEKADGSPFLEVHHVKRLAEQGSDTVSNAVAICPNCHRQLHHGINAKTLVENLYSTVERLVRE